MSQTLYISAVPGVTSAKLFTTDTDTVVSTAASVTAGTNDPSWYTIVFNPDVASASYRLVMYISTSAVASTIVTASGSSIAESSSVVTVLPVSGVAVDRVSGTTLTYFVGESGTTSVAVIDADGDSVDTTSMTLTIVFEDAKTRTDVATIANASIAKTTTSISFAVPSAVTTSERSLIWSLRNTTDVLLQGVCNVVYAAKGD